MHGEELDYTILVGVKVRPSHFDRGHHACLISFILFLVLYEMNLDLGVTRRNASASGRAKGIKGVEVINLI